MLEDTDDCSYRLLTYRWYASTRTSRGDARNATPLRPTKTQSYQGTLTEWASSLRKMSGHRSRLSSVVAGGKDCFRASRICLSLCSSIVIALPALSFRIDAKLTQAAAQDANRAKHSHPDCANRRS